MPDAALTPEQILLAAEDVLRRYGPAKATVVDVARALGVSHGSVYRHFPSKTALREAVTRRWLERTCAPLPGVANGDGPPPERLRRWLATLVAVKRKKVLDDPELFATYAALFAGTSDVIAAHIDELTHQIARIISDGVATGDFNAADPVASARAVFDATSRFHNPALAGEWSDPGIDREFDGVCDLVLAGLGAAPRQASSPGVLTGG